MPDVDGRRREIIDGEIVEIVRAGYIHKLVKANLTEILASWLAQNRIGKFFVETSYRLEEHWAPILDLSVLPRERPDPVTQSLIRGAPELAIEVVSSDAAEYLLSKVQAYLKHGSAAVWIVFPDQRVVQVYTKSMQRNSG